MKKVFQNSMVAHVWAQQIQEEGRSNNGQFFFKGRTIYSYRYSWPLAHFHESGFIILNTQSYSMSTSRHLSEVRSALGYGNENVIGVDSTEILTDIVNGYGSNQTIANKICETVKKQANDHIKSAAKRKKEALRFSDIGKALSWITTAEKLCTMLESTVQFHEQLGKLQNDLRENSAALIASKGDEIKIEHENERKRKAERKERAKANHDIELEKFRAGENFSSWHLKEFTDKVYMRVKDDEIETSRGASFPVKHAKEAFKLLRVLKEKGVTYTPLGNKTIHLGHFKIDKVDAAGNVTAGCHYVEWDQIEACAVALEIYP